jgi:hypothetical protein
MNVAQVCGRKYHHYRFALEKQSHTIDSIQGLSDDSNEIAIRVRLMMTTLKKKPRLAVTFDESVDVATATSG